MYLAVAILGILLLYFIVILSKPVEIDIDEIEHFEGKRVIVHGIVIHKDILEDSEILLIENGTSTLHIFSTFSSHTHYGDEIEVVGKAEKYKGQWKVVADEIKITKRWDVESIPSGNYLSMPWNMIERMLTLQGMCTKFFLHILS